MHSLGPKGRVIRGDRTNAVGAHRHRKKRIVADCGVIRAVIDDGICGIQFAAVRLPLERVSHSRPSPSCYCRALDGVVEHGDGTRAIRSH